MQLKPAPIMIIKPPKKLEPARSMGYKGFLSSPIIRKFLIHELQVHDISELFNFS